ncbi:carboxymuconolactone decarboxylase family protein [Parasphingorhabdus sp.]|uniref:carboxymuconolactone decarboxylase family protein n=1 Tax=Parasphingorhabdus sp. TaxID=2709688 RepID=UPI003A9203A1
MTTIKPRINHVPREEWTDDTREVFAFWGEPNAWEEGSKTNIMNVMGNHPDLGKAYNIWGKHLLMGNTLSSRILEIIILRVAVKANSAYEWHNHVGYGMNAGLSLEEIAAIRDYPEGGQWDPIEKAILDAVEELTTAGNLTDQTWDLLAGHFNTKQMMDLVFTIGHYVMTSWALSAFGVEIEGGADPIGFDLKTKSGRTPGKTYKPGEKEDWVDTRGY